jgi:hypothetical protein
MLARERSQVAVDKQLRLVAVGERGDEPYINIDDFGSHRVTGTARYARGTWTTGSGPVRSTTAPAGWRPQLEVPAPGRGA